MEDTQEVKQLSYELKAFVGSYLREISNQALELVNQVEAVKFKEILERDLTRQIIEAVLRLSIVYDAVLGVSGSWQVQKLIFGAVKEVKYLDFGELTIEEFVGSKLRELGSQAFELGNKVHSFSSKKDLGSVLVQEMKEVMDISSTIFRAVIGLKGKQLVQELLTGALLRFKRLNFTTVNMEIK